MISIEKILLKRFVLSAAGLIVVLALLHHWWAEQFFLKIQKQQLQQESSALSHHLTESDLNQLTSLNLNLPEHSGHLYYIQQGDTRWSSAPELTANLPITLWLEQEGTHAYQTTDGKSYLSLSLSNTDGTRFIVIQETTFSLVELDQSHSYMFLVMVFTLIIIILLLRRVIRNVFSRLDPLSAEIAALHRGETPNLKPTEIVEISPLVSSVNRLLSYLDSRSQRSKHAVGDLSHAMKTPLAVIRQLVERNNNCLSKEDRCQLLEQADQLNHIVSRELKRARIAGRGSNTESFSIHQATQDLTDTLLLIHPDKPLHFTLEINPQAFFPGDQTDFNELMGNLLDNAAKWCNKEVQVVICPLAESLQIRVADDGPGCDEERIAQLFERGTRLDEQAEGHGLGLNIVSAIVTQYDGSIHIRNVPALGLEVTLHFPLSWL